MSPRGCGIPIVLTATIVPSAGGSSVTDPTARRADYLKSIAFYRQFAPVYFLENSTYPLESDPEFNPAPDFFVRRFPPSIRPERGKGFQEFNMLDAWFESEETMPVCWLKISGRYQVHNVAALLAECVHRPAGQRLMIDQLGRVRLARTYLFFVETNYYLERLRNLYRDCDDTRGDWIERVIFRALRQDASRSFATFATQPQISAVAGSTGHQFSPGILGFLVKSALRRLNRVFDRRYLLYQNHA